MREWLIISGNWEGNNEKRQECISRIGTYTPAKPKPEFIITELWYYNLYLDIIKEYPVLACTHTNQVIFISKELDLCL